MEKETIEDIINLYKKGNSLQLVSKKTGISYWKVRNVIKSKDFLRSRSEAGKLMKNNKGQFKKGAPSWNKGLPWPNEFRKKSSLTHRETYINHPELHQKISIATREAMKNIPYEKLAYWKRKSQSIETVKKRVEKIKGSNHWNWKGGISPGKYPFSFGQVRKIIKEKYKNTCQICGRVKTDYEHDFHVHHIDMVKENLEIENLILLCPSCHISYHIRRVLLSAA